MKPKDELERMSIDELKNYIDQLAGYIKESKDLLKQKIRENPSISIHLRQRYNQFYVYSSFGTGDRKNVGQKYLGKYGDENTYAKVKELAKERPKLLEDYENLKEKLEDKK